MEYCNPWLNCQGKFYTCMSCNRVTTLLLTETIEAVLDRMNKKR